MLRNKRGQSTLEYALLILVIVAALLAMGTYMKKAVQGRIKESTDEVGRQFDQPDAYKFAWKNESSGLSETSEQRIADSGGVINTVISNAEVITRSEYEAWGNTTGQYTWP